MKLLMHVASMSLHGLEDCVKFLTDSTLRNTILDAANVKTLEMIALVRSAPDNPYGANEEDIACELMRQVTARLNKQNKYIKK